jgi:predicted enzyme related to lactoylglutathione lyase
MRLKAKLIAMNVPTNNAAVAEGFYTALLGIDFARSFTVAAHSMHAPLAEEGLWIWLTNRHAPEARAAAVYAVDDLNATLAELTKAGGHKVYGPIDAPIAPQLVKTYESKVGHALRSHSMGSFVLVRDPDDNYLWVGQLTEHSHKFFAFGAHDKGLSQAKIDEHHRTKKEGSTLP